MYGPISMLGYPALVVRVLVIGLLLLRGGCAALVPAPTPILPPGEIDKCRERIDQKEVWVANYYFTLGNPSAARQRLELVMKDYPRTAVIPETLFLLAEVNFYEGKNAEAIELLRRLSVDYDFTEWGRRGKQRLNSSGLAGTKR